MKIEVKGIVQGVGFRPFIHKLVETYSLNGWVKNTSSGVIIEIEGKREALNKFVIDIKDKSPKLSFIDSIDSEILNGMKNYKDFKIIKSTEENFERFTLISPDVCVCEECTKELLDTNNRRYKYPFINCTNCGPRFTIIKDIPYDREKTTMKDFKLCDSCKVEYEELEDRRYHAQPNCCPKCGPELYFTDNVGTRIQGDPITIARQYILEDKIIAIKGLGGFHLVCNANNPEVVKEIRKRKQRDEKPFAIMCRNVEVVKKWCFVNAMELELLESSKRPIVLLKKKNGDMDITSSDNNYLGVMLPYTPVHFLLFEKDIDTVIMTSGNISDTPILYKNEEAIKALREIAHGFLLNNREIHVRCDDSLVRVFEGKEYLIRRSRGYVPFPIKLSTKMDNILACGGEQKANFALSRSEYVFMSQHIGDMKNMETLQNYTSQISHFENMFDIKPEMIACDYHPDYMSTQYGEDRARRDKIPLHYIQHHHAHMASCMGDNNLKEDVIGVVWDGTGYGVAGEIWGGEFLIGGYSNFERFGSIRPIMLPGGDKAIKEIYRIAYAILFDTLGYIPEKYKVTQNADVLERVMQEEVNCPKASSMGRLFDGIAAILKIKLIASYEGQGAIALEGVGDKIETEEIYEFDIYKSGDINVIDWRRLVKQILLDVENKVEVGIISAKFMNTVAKMAGNMLKTIATQNNIKEVVLSGGVFQNMYILVRVKREIEKLGFKVYVHNRVSTNDEGIALGQILIAQNGGSVKCV